MALAVPIAHMSCGNIGRLWGKLKVTAGECPPWEFLKEAVFWKDAGRYQRQWDVLAGEVRRPGGQAQEATTGEGSAVQTSNFDFEADGKTITKVAAWGTCADLLQHRRVHLLWAEVGSDGLPKETKTVLEKVKDCHLLLIGVEDGMFKALAQLNKLKEEHAVLWQYKTSMIHLHLKEDPPLGPRQAPHVNVTRKVLLASPQPLKTHRNYVALDYPWRCSVISHLLTMFDVPEKGVFTTMLYLPHAVRPTCDILNKMGHVLAQCNRWQVSFTLPEDTPALEVTSQLQSIVVTAHSTASQCDYERSVLSRGMALCSYNLFQQTTKQTTGPSTPTKVTQEEEGAVSSRRQGNADPDEQDKSPSKAGAGHQAGNRFKAPRRTTGGQPTGTALGDRQGKTKSRLTAEMLEANAEELAERASKKARYVNTTGNAGRGKKGKTKAGDKSGALDLSDFPDGEQ